VTIFAPCVGGPLDGHHVPVEPNRWGKVWGRWMVGPLEADITDGQAEEYDPAWGAALRREWGGDYRLYVPRPGEPLTWTWRPGKPWNPVTLAEGDPSLGSRARLFLNTDVPEPQKEV
jgi:hypothetical protein